MFWLVIAVSIGLIVGMAWLGGLMVNRRGGGRRD
jgi:hypothetical protein